MRRPLILALGLLASVAVRVASAQSVAPPVEVGLDVSALLVANGSHLQRGPRLVVNFDGRNAMQFTANLQKLAEWEDTAQIETDLYIAAYRRLVYAGGPVRAFATFGGGLERTLIVTRPVTFGDPPVTFPSTRGVEVLPAVTTGVGIDFRLARRAAIFLESSFVLTERLNARFSGGLIVPVGSYPAQARLAPTVPWAKLDAGERAWVTTDGGREVDGEVVTRSVNTLTLRTLAGTVLSFGADDIRAIDTTDPIRNGTMLGLKIGGIGAIAPAVLISLLFCALEDCSTQDVVQVNAFLIGIGAGIGAAAGALTDSLRERRVPLYRRGASTTVTVAPIVTGGRMGGGAVIRW